jgi:hypothetical protein
MLSYVNLIRTTGYARLDHWSDLVLPLHIQVDQGFEIWTANPDPELAQIPSGSCKRITGETSRSTTAANTPVRAIDVEPKVD